MMVKKNYFNIFKNGSVSTRLSYVIMGAGNLAHKQIAKGLLFLFSELAFLFFPCVLWHYLNSRYGDIRDS